MMVMPADNSGSVARLLAAKYPGHIGHLYSPGSRKGPFEIFPYALDNGRYCLLQGKPWSEAKFIELLEWAAQKTQRPLWVVVPDVPEKRDETLREWDRWHGRVSRYGFLLAMAVQDGMTPADVPPGVVAFIGGSLAWKPIAMEMFSTEVSRVHVGRVCRPKWLWKCREHGIESVDGTGWFRGDQRQLRALKYFVESDSRGTPHPQSAFPFEARREAEEKGKTT